jgi:hypothetical protein
MSSQPLSFQPPLVVHRYWSSCQPDEPHVGFGTRGRKFAHGLTGLALSGSAFGLFATFGLNPFTVVVTLAGLALAPLLRVTETGWYEVDADGTVINFIGRHAPKYIRGRSGVNLATFRSEVSEFR